MAVFEWDNKFSVNIALIDSHHKKLFDIMNKIYDLMARGADDSSIIQVIGELLDYTNYHFSEEENMMSRIGYPELSQHQQYHRDFVSKLTGYHTDAKNGKAIFVAIKVADMGVDWLKSHILSIDNRYQNYIESNNITV